MTTAARPTFEPARGGSGKGEKDLSALSKQYSSRDLPSHTRVKYRQPGQDTVDELRSRDFRKDLEDRERSANRERKGERGERERESQHSSSSKKARLEQISQSTLDADDPLEDDDDDEDEDDESDDEDTAELMAELSKIKKERAEEMIRKEIEKKAEEEKIRMENILHGNPLLAASQQSKGDFSVKRRWDDDVVFKNCARGQIDNKKTNFINDTLRSEFHKKFMDKYVK